MSIPKYRWRTLAGDVALAVDVVIRTTCKEMKTGYKTEKSQVIYRVTDKDLCENLKSIGYKLYLNRA
ncbi:MAG: hypothetical protein C4B59_17300 [Candidatus Methanogaster sp.]|uniref:Uncharacterized protein n=1 Tax=Candidatus Methanogaster sp. TaxID=3386292 RepID=A0AC61KXZ6_9EURY|nr:MAG: hypothetical protein C4B59_17300 [ANME-2 cluster archaeon]